MNGDKNNRARIIISSGGGQNSMRYVKMEGIDFENNGKMNMGQIDMKNTGYINEREGITNIEGKISTDGPIVNRGVFNVKKFGKVSIELNKIRRAHPFWFWLEILSSVIGVVTGIIYLISLI